MYPDLADPEKLAGLASRLRAACLARRPDGVPNMVCGCTISGVTLAVAFGQACLEHGPRVLVTSDVPTRELAGNAAAAPLDRTARVLLIEYAFTRRVGDRLARAAVSTPFSLVGIACIEHDDSVQAGKFRYPGLVVPVFKL